MTSAYGSTKESDGARFPRILPEQTVATAIPAEADIVAKHQRIGFLDVAKGMGILLVVMGHCLGGLHDASLLDNTSFGWHVFYFIYCFHMPLFFFLSGSLVEARIRTKPLRFLQANVTRIAYPYFLWGLVQTTVLLLASNLINHPIHDSIISALGRIFWAPPGQFWFLYVLFLLHMTALLTIWLGGRTLFALAFTVLYAVSAISPATSDIVSNYVSGSSILFYVLGVCFGGSIIGWRGKLQQPYVWALISFVLFLTAAWQGWIWGQDWYSYATLPAAFAGSAAVLLAARSDAFCNNQWLVYLGRRSMPIYVLHVLFVAGTRIVLDKFFHISGLGLILPTIFLAGVIGPLLVDRAARTWRLQPVLGLG
jgi:fucose 4-O-acetylase-like acetyltransferase